MGRGSFILLAGLCLAGCSSTSVVTTTLGSAVSGAVSAGQAVIGVAGSAGGALLSGAVSVGSGVVGVAGSLAEATGMTASSSSPATTGTPANGGSGNVALVEATLASQTDTGSADQAIEAIGQDAIAESGRLLSLSRNPLDRCALRVFRQMAQSTGVTIAYRWAEALAESAVPIQDRLALTGMLSVVSRIRGQMAELGCAIRDEIQQALNLPLPIDLRDAFTAAADMDAFCPAGLAGRLVELTLENN